MHSFYAFLCDWRRGVLLLQQQYNSVRTRTGASAGEGCAHGENAEAGRVAQKTAISGAGPGRFLE
ncbi:hypothetical protein CW354_02870 [Marinicaulis flavus]|uniref:Uncharacterized protein n=2 Tax=Hyphococcus luteus TaxID=2058213 RepID=A0A2S7K8S9_9PROT|nr:hypothetical protein CW354_02870 [Marinicaulis flavus]